MLHRTIIMCVGKHINLMTLTQTLPVMNNAVGAAGPRRVAVWVASEVFKVHKLPYFHHSTLPFVSSLAPLLLTIRSLSVTINECKASPSKPHF